MQTRAANKLNLDPLRHSYPSGISSRMPSLLVCVRRPTSYFFQLPHGYKASIRLHIYRLTVCFNQ
jgi:hypothetical protein